VVWRPVTFNKGLSDSTFVLILKGTEFNVNKLNSNEINVSALINFVVKVGTMMKLSNKRWTVVILIFLATSINYLDRSVLGVAGPSMMEDLDMTKGQFGILASAFFWTYALMQIPVGSIVDKFGAKLIYGVAVVWWSACTIATGLVRNFGVLIGVRALMGIGESPAFPTNTRVISDWLPTHERGFANGLFTMGIAVGAGLTTPAVAWIVERFGWEFAFVVTGALGAVWVVFWIFQFKNKPSEHKQVNKAELEYIQAGQPNRGVVRETKVPWYQMMKSRNVNVILYGLFAQDYLLYLMLTWLPAYLVMERGMTLLKAGFNSIIPWVAASIGALLGGWLSDYLIKRGWSPISARRQVMTIGMILSLAIIPAAFVTNVAGALALISLSLGGMMFANGGSWAIVADIAPNGSVGTLAGMQNFIGNLAGWIAPVMTGFMAQALGSFVWALVIAGVIGGVAAIAYLFLLRDRDEFAVYHTKEVTEGIS
jgi:MFS transporter, ACS family, D-galactonate transporter